jgi:hypothetical protein
MLGGMQHRAGAQPRGLEPAKGWVGLADRPLISTCAFNTALLLGKL